MFIFWELRSFFRPHSGYLHFCSIWISVLSEAGLLRCKRIRSVCLGQGIPLKDYTASEWEQTHFCPVVAWRPLGQWPLDCPWGSSSFVVHLGGDRTPGGKKGLWLLSNSAHRGEILQPATIKHLLGATRRQGSGDMATVLDLLCPHDWVPTHSKAKQREVGVFDGSNLGTWFKVL